MSAADLGLSSRLSGLGGRLRSVWQGGGGVDGGGAALVSCSLTPFLCVRRRRCSGSGPPAATVAAAALVSSSWTPFLCVRRRLCSCSVPPAAAVASPAAEMKEDNKEELGDVVLDRAKFRQQLRLRAVRIPKQHAHFVSKALSRFTLERSKLKHVIHDPESSENRLVLLDQHTDGSDVLKEKLAEIRQSLPIDIIPHDIDLDYTYFSVEQVLREILPAGWKVPASFETVVGNIPLESSAGRGHEENDILGPLGHIAHLNLTDELLPYRKIIAEVFLDKNQPKIRTIVNKVGTISNEFRVPTWEVLAGDTNLVTEVRQHSARFRLDFGLVYWNSRLEFEHKRLCSNFQPGQIILDMFAGIGPFAIPAAQQGCAVFANDLNPTSVQYLEVNSKINKVTGNIKAYNLDAREFMRNLQRREGAEASENGENRDLNGSVGGKAIPLEVNPETFSAEDTGSDPIGEGEQMVKKGIIKRKSGNAKGLNATRVAIAEAKPWELFHHVVMNLPASALEFLDVFQGLLSRDTWQGPLPRIHCYCFMRASETTEDVLKRAETILGGLIEDPEVWTVRDVAPNKIMLCLSFELPQQVAFGGGFATPHNAMGLDSLDSGLEPSAQLPHLHSKRLRTRN